MLTLNPPTAIDDDRDLKAIRKLFKAGNGSQGLQPVA